VKAGSCLREAPAFFWKNIAFTRARDYDNDKLLKRREKGAAFIA
jgi:hypothetical protein